MQKNNSSFIPHFSTQSAVVVEESSESTSYCNWLAIRLRPRHQEVEVSVRLIKRVVNRLQVLLPWGQTPQAQVHGYQSCVVLLIHAS